MRRVGVMLSRRPFAIPFGRTRRPYLSCRTFASRNPSVGSSRLLDHHSGHCNILSEKQESPNEQITFTPIRPYALFSYRGSSTAQYAFQMRDPTNHIMTYRKPDAGLLTTHDLSGPNDPESHKPLHSTSGAVLYIKLAKTHNHPLTWQIE